MLLKRAPVQPKRDIDVVTSPANTKKSMGSLPKYVIRSLSRDSFSESPQIPMAKMNNPIMEKNMFQVKVKHLAQWLNESRGRWED